MAFPVLKIHQMQNQYLPNISAARFLLYHLSIDVLHEHIPVLFHNVDVYVRINQFMLTPSCVSTYRQYISTIGFCSCNFSERVRGHVYLFGIVTYLYLQFLIFMHQQKIRIVNLILCTPLITADLFRLRYRT